MSGRMIFRPAAPMRQTGRLTQSRAPQGPELRGQTVCFTGHRRLTRQEAAMLAARLDMVLEALFHRGYRRFVCGGALGFDTLAAEQVLQLQARHPEVQLVMALPCGNQAQRWSQEDGRRYERILYAADETHVLSPVYYDGCMMVRNRFMVDHSSLCVCYLCHMKGGTMSTVAYALRERLPVLNVAMEDVCAAFLEETKH